MLASPFFFFIAIVLARIKRYFRPGRNHAAALLIINKY
jgi:hypothetical protein